MATVTTNTILDTQTTSIVVCTGVFASATQETSATKITGSALAYYNTYVASISVSGTGTGYTNGDLLIFTGGSGTGASGYINADGNGNITSAVVFNGGSGYASSPTVSLTTSGGSGQTLTATLTPVVTPILAIDKVLYSISSGAIIEVIFDGNTPQTALVLTGTGEIDLQAKGMSIVNGAITPSGNILFTTLGFAANGGYTVVLQCKKMIGYGGSLGGYN